MLGYLDPPGNRLHRGYGGYGCYCGLVRHLLILAGYDMTVYVYVFIHACMHACIYICIYCIYIYAYIYVYIYMYIVLA